MLKYGLVILVAIYLSLLYLNRNGNLFTSDECDATTYEASTPNNAANSANADKGCHVGEGEVEEVIIR